MYSLYVRAQVFIIIIPHPKNTISCMYLFNYQKICIYFSGLVLQDLTFVHIGNNDLLPDGTINFSKRWQQFNIVENMKRFKKG